MSAVEEDEAETLTKTADSTWNVGGLKREVQRLLLRCHKKVGKARTRLTRGENKATKMAANPETTVQEMEEHCPNVDALRLELDDLVERLQKLNALEEELGLIKTKGTAVLPEAVATLALDLGVNDEPPARPPRGPTKKKGPRRSEFSRLPYRRYYSAQNIEIRVGKQAADNDELTLSPQHRDGSDFWMHAAGCPGSHVVIRSNGQTSLPPEVIQDAAALAARQSKAKHSPTVPVSMTQCRDIVKPPGAKAGLVQLRGRVQTIKVNMKEAQARLKRLDSTVLVN